jgi:hypothetical protein
MADLELQQILGDGDVLGRCLEDPHRHELDAVRNRVRALILGKVDTDPDRAAFIEENVPADLYVKPSYDLQSFFHRTSLSFLRLLRAQCDSAQWESFLRQPDQVSQISKAWFFGRPDFGPKKDEFDAYKRRETVPVIAPSGLERKKAELEEILQGKMLGQVVKALVSQLTVAPPKGGDGWFGDYNRKSGGISLSTHGRNSEMVFPTLLHELGHALDKWLIREEGGMELFEYYILLTQLESTIESPYADSIALKDGRNSGLFIKESFAEDFRLFLIKPSGLSISKKMFFEKVWEMIFPEIPLEDLRVEIRLLLGDFHGKSIGDLLKKTRCRNPVKMARAALRKEQVDEAERLEEEKKRKKLEEEEA